MKYSPGQNDWHHQAAKLWRKPAYAEVWRPAKDLRTWHGFCSTCHPVSMEWKLKLTIFRPFYVLKYRAFKCIKCRFGVVVPLSTDRSNARQDKHLVWILSKPFKLLSSRADAESFKALPREAIFLVKYLWWESIGGLKTPCCGVLDKCGLVFMEPQWKERNKKSTPDAFTMLEAVSIWVVLCITRALARRVTLKLWSVMLFCIQKVNLCNVLLGK